jgi:hypothetical protein
VFCVLCERESDCRWDCAYEGVRERPRVDGCMRLLVVENTFLFACVKSVCEYVSMREAKR